MNEHEDNTEALQPTPTDSSAPAVHDVDAVGAPAVPSVPQAKQPRLFTPILVFCLAMAWMIAAAMVAGFVVAMELTLAGELTPRNVADAGPILAEAMVRPGSMILVFALTAMGSITIALGAAWLSPVPLMQRLRLRAPPWRRRLLGYLLAALGMLAAGETAMALIDIVTDSRSSSLLALNKLAAESSPVVFALLLVFGGALAPIGEELVFRGYIQTRFRQRFSPVVAVVATATLFGVMHLDLIHSLAAAVMGLFAGWVTERCGSIRPAVVAHCVNNITAFVAARLGANDDRDMPWWVVPVSLAASVLLTVAMHRFMKTSTTND